MIAASTDASSLLSLARRARVLTTVINITLAIAIGGAFFIADSWGGYHSFLLVGVLVAWFAATSVAVRSRQQIAASQELIAKGDLDGATSKLRQVLRGVYVPSIHRRTVLANTVQVYQIQQRWRDVATLGQAILRSAAPRDAQPPVMLVLQALVELRDLPGAFEMLQRAEAMPRSLQVSLYLMLVRLDLEVTTGANHAATLDLWKKMELAELLPATPAAMAHAFLSLALQRKGQRDEAAWFKRRSELLAEPATLVKQRSVLAELWPEHRS